MQCTRGRWWTSLRNKSPCKQWYDRGFLFTSWLLVDFMYPDGFPFDEKHKPSIDWNVRPIEKFQWAITVSSHIMVPPTTLALLWPCDPTWIKDGSFCGIGTKPWGLKGMWIIGSYNHMVYQMCWLPPWCKYIIGFCAKFLSSPIVWAI